MLASHDTAIPFLTSAAPKLDTAIHSRNHTNIFPRHQLIYVAQEKVNIAGFELKKCLYLNVHSSTDSYITTSIIHRNIILVVHHKIIALYSIMLLHLYDNTKYYNYITPDIIAY